jgi:glycosyltransferase involved in cell wall biosynthesis
MNEFLSVVVCTYNRADSLRNALETVISQDTAANFTFEAVVVDDHSTDHTRATVESLALSAPNVRYVLNENAKGVVGARNMGIRAARGEWIVFFDDDQLAERGWLAGLVEVVRAHGALIAGGARRLDLPEAQLRDLGPVFRSLLGENLYDGPPVIMRGKELPTTGNLLVAKAVFERVGEFGVGIDISSGEDAELIGRARAAGIEVWTAPRAMVAHMIPAYRTSVPYLRWVSRRWGAHFAQIDAKRGGNTKMAVLALARAAQAVLQSAPQWLLAVLRGNGPRRARCAMPAVARRGLCTQGALSARASGLSATSLS